MPDTMPRTRTEALRSELEEAAHAAVRTAERKSGSKIRGEARRAAVALALELIAAEWLNDARETAAALRVILSSQRLGGRP